MQQCSLRGLRVLTGPPRVTNQPNGSNSHEIFATEYEINDNFNKSLIHIIFDKLKNKMTLPIISQEVKLYLDPGIRLLKTWL